MPYILCLYYSRTGTTETLIREIAQELGCEMVRLEDGVDRRGWRGWLRCGLDAVRRTTRKVDFQTQFPLIDYRLVVVGSPVWAGRCSSVVRGFLKRHGRELRNASYVLTRGSEEKSESIFDQMDLYTPCGHRTAVSLRPGSVGCAFWQDEFLRQTREFLQSGKR